MKPCKRMKVCTKCNAYQDKHNVCCLYPTGRNRCCGNKLISVIKPINTNQNA